ncbi:MAG: hypothetical protein JSR77_12400 [Planctomycetes bacterium]|nr:hypothetical protein [Planctomycetota bacterium]
MPSALRRAAIACTLALPLFAAPAHAQPPAPGGPQPLRPPTPGKPDEPPIIMNYLSLFVIIATVVGANLIPSKRGHQD